MRLNLTQRGKTYPARTLEGLTDQRTFLDSVGGGAWPLIVRGAICLVNSVNERDSNLLNRRSDPSSRTFFLEGQAAFSCTRQSDSRSVMPLDVRGRTRATLKESACAFPVR